MIAPVPIDLTTKEATTNNAMQYLSKAYNYYSGINPATLTGAIDVIVVRHVDDAGEVHLSSSPFHVRFGKLQVLRAGEKRVTITLPENIAAPHIAPFSMKVGETGEAFFVMETDEDVPPDLATSPLMLPGDPLEEGTPPSPPVSDTSDPHTRTQEPFGQGDASSVNGLRKVDYLDLNAVDDSNDSAQSLDEAQTQRLDEMERAIKSPSSYLDATGHQTTPDLSVLGDHSEPDSISPAQHDQSLSRSALPPPEARLPPPNPLAAEPGEKAALPSRDHRLSHISLLQNNGPEGLPKVPAGEGEPPSVIYGKDVVLDIAGYHSKEAGQADPVEKDTEILDSESSPSEPELGLPRTPQAPPREESSTQASTQVTNYLVDSLRRDLQEAAAAQRHALAGPADDLHLDDLDQLTLSEDTRVEPLFQRASSEPSTGGEGLSTSSPSLSRTPKGTLISPALPPRPRFDVSLGLDPAADVAEHEDDVDDIRSREMLRAQSLPPSDHPGSSTGSRQLSVRLKNVEDNPYLIVVDVDGIRSHTFELSLCGEADFAISGNATESEETAFLRSRITFQNFVEDATLVDDHRLVLRYSLMYLTWANANSLLRAFSDYCHSLGPSDGETPTTPPVRPTSGYGWTRWWRGSQETVAAPGLEIPTKAFEEENRMGGAPKRRKNYAKTLRLTSEQLKLLNLKPGPNDIRFSATSSYSGRATCAARIFLWDDTDQIVISDIDGTITKSDALGHVFAAIGKDWTHLGIAKLYTDISNNGYRMLYLTSRAIGQADSTREYLRTIVQGEYRLPEGPVIMSPDRLIASLHREVILRKPELFKMACLRDIQRLFGSNAKTAFFAGFGNRITDAMSYRSVGIEAAKIYTIDSTGVVKTELLQAAGHKGSYIQLNDLVNEVFPPVSTKANPEFTDYLWWRPMIEEFDIPDLAPPSPTLSARGEPSSSRLSVLGKIATLGRRSSKPILPISEANSRPPSSLGRSPSFDELPSRGRASTLSA